MAKHKKGKASPAKAVTATPAERHTFSYGGLLGHDLTASEWLVNVSEQTALGLDVVQDCVRIIADAIAGADVGQWNGTQRIDPPSGFTLRPDPDLTRREFLWRFAANLALYQAVYLEEATFAGQVVGVRQHCIANVTHVGDDLYVGGKLIRNRMKLVRMSVWPTLDLDTGATIALAREVFAGSLAANAYQSDFWQQGGAPVLVLKTDQAITTTQATSIQDQWVTQRTTSPGKPAVMGSGIDAKPLSADLGARGAMDSTDRQRASIARYFKMVPEMVNVPSEAGPLHYTTEEQIAIRLVRYTLQPYADVIGEALSSYLPGDYLLGDVIKLGLNKLLVADQNTRYQAWAIATGTAPGQSGVGFMRLSEVREAEGLTPDAELDDLQAKLSEVTTSVGA